MEYTKSLDYAKEIAQRNKPKLQQPSPLNHKTATISFVTQYNRSTTPYDTVLSTCCSLAHRFTKHATQPVDYFDWDGIIFEWLCKKFMITQYRDYENEVNGEEIINTFIQIESTSGERSGLDIEPVISRIINTIKEHLRDVYTVPHGKEDSVPLWFGNETTKEHDLEVISKYKGKSNITIPLGGNFNTTRIKEPVTFKKVIVSRVHSGGEVTSVVQQNLNWIGEDGKVREMDYRLRKLYDEGLITLEDPQFIVECNKELVRINTERAKPLKAKKIRDGKRRAVVPVTSSGSVMTFDLS